MVEGDVEQCRLAEAAVGLQRLDQQVERQRLVLLVRCGLRGQPRQQVGERLVRVDLRPHHLHVDEAADQRLGLAALAVGDRHADAQVGLAGIAAQQHRVGGQQGQVQRCTARGGKRAQSVRHGGGNGKHVLGALAAARGAARAVGGQVERGARAVAQAFAPVAELAPGLAGLHPVALPGGIVGVLHRQWRQSCLRAGIAGGQFGDEAHDRRAVGDDMVQHHDQHVRLRAFADQRHPPRRSGNEIERFIDYASDRCAEAVRIGVDHGKGRRQVFMHLLAGDTGSIGRIRGAQHFMARADLRERAAQRHGVERALEPVHARHVIGGAGGFQLLQEPQALLRIRQRQRACARRRHDGQRGKRHAFAVQHGQEGGALHRLQPGKTRGDLCGDLRGRGTQCV
ncbi:hypothetical protein D9M68_417380 [compost metagenome]